MSGEFKFEPEVLTFAMLLHLEQLEYLQLLDQPVEVWFFVYYNNAKSIKIIR